MQSDDRPERAANPLAKAAFGALFIAAGVYFLMTSEPGTTGPRSRLPLNWLSVALIAIGAGLLIHGLWSRMRENR